MFSSKQDAERRLAQFLMDDMPLGECKALPAHLPGDWFMRFRRARAEFLGSLEDSIQELALLNLQRDDFMDLLTAKRLPENLCLRFRRPILYGGEISAGNMFLMMNFPYGINMDAFMAAQSGQDDIWYPDPEKKIYVSLHVISSAAGGNATSDRLAQGFAAQVMRRDDR